MKRERLRTSEKQIQTANMNSKTGFIVIDLCHVEQHVILRRKTLCLDVSLRFEDEKPRKSCSERRNRAVLAHSGRQHE